MQSNHFIEKRFVKKVLKELNENCPHNAEQEDILFFVEDTLRHLEEEDSYDCKTNQRIL